MMDKPASSPFKKAVRRMGKILVWLIVLLAAFLLIERFRGQIALENFKRKLLAKGEKLSPEDFKVTVNQTDNGAPAAIAAIRNIESGMVLPLNTPPRRRILASGRAIVGFRESEWIESGGYKNGEWKDGLTTNDWKQIASDLKTNETLLVEICAALENPVLRNDVDLSQGLKLRFDWLTPAKSSTHWLGSASELALHDGRNEDAARWLEKQVQLQRLLADDPVVISHLVRFAMSSIALADTWEAMQAGGWRDNQLAAIQKAWERQHSSADLSFGMEGERIYCSKVDEQLRESNEETYNLLFGPFSKMLSAFTGDENASWGSDTEETSPVLEEVINLLRKQVYCRIWRFSWSHQAELREQRGLQRLIELVRDGVKQKSNQGIETDVEMLVSEMGDKNFYDRLRYPEPDSPITLSRTLFRAMKSETARSMAIAAIAIKRHALRHGSPPESLGALVPAFLVEVPVDFMDGKPIRYRRNEDGTFMLYSVGEDGKDGGGDLAYSKKGSSSSDLWARRDYVWPAPATPDEVEDYRKESRTN
ncbi:MAG: hypothetical protein HOP33_06710 [Verrucomicrobia bacterium]|nr:hypothetical protein [Verrucomicrobiota bacterium]